MFKTLEKLIVYKQLRWNITIKILRSEKYNQLFNFKTLDLN